MVAPLRFRTIRQKLGPSWLTSPDTESGLLGYSLDIIKDAFIERLRLGLLARFPQNGPNGETAPAAALAAMGRDRRVVRGLEETDVNYALRLKAWLDDRKRAGSPFALLQKLAEYLGPLPSFRTVDVAGNWFSRAADGTETIDLAQDNWDWDSANYPDEDTSVQRRWSRFWVIIYPNGLWFESLFDWGDGAGSNWGEDINTWGSTAPQEQVVTVRSIIGDWKPAGTRCVNIIVAFDANSFDPTAPEPDGLWEHWSKNVAGVQVPSRLATARYWDGVR